VEFGRSARSLFRVFNTLRQHPLIAAATDDAAGHSAGVLALIDDQETIDYHVGDTFGIGLGLLEGIGLAHLIGIEKDDIGGEAFVESGRGQRSR
jgi:hypothetical protein